jgi:tRNA-dihydrouridine synthase 1
MVRTLAQGLTIPIFVKIRLLNTIEESIELCQQLVDAGAALIAIHARYRVNLVGRSGPGAR